MNQTQHKRHRMPFGAEILDDGGVHFRLWAPGVGAVALQLDDDGDDVVPMQPASDGWFERVHAEARAGSRYRFLLPDGLHVPDPASRCNPDDVHAASEVIDPLAYAWRHGDWRGRPWEEAVIYELHIGTFSPAGTFAGVEERLDYLVQLGVTALEIMPVADFPGTRNWGYDGVLPFAPDAVYGRPDDFKHLIDAAHARGLMVFLDVVYNHFGPEGNYLHAYAQAFFNPRHTTPWGAAINFDAEGSRQVRDFFIHNALYWIEEFHLDGLRLDAIHAICDDSSPDIVEELAAAIHSGPGSERQVHLILENDRNQARYLERDGGGKGRPLQATAQWNDDIHHVLHVLASGENDGYYADYATQPAKVLARCLTEGFAYQGEASPYRDGELRGEPSAHLPPAAFIDFLQTHDQVGNRAFGERLCHLASPPAMAAVTAVLLLAPATPFLFQGEEFAAAQPFLFFCDFADFGDLAQAVTEGRRREFAGFARFADPAVREHIPDPNAAATFTASVLDWEALTQEPHRGVLALHRQLLALRRQWITPRLAGMGNGSPQTKVFSDTALAVSWRLGDGSRLQLAANLGEDAASIAPLLGQQLFASAHLDRDLLGAGSLSPWSVVWHLQTEGST
ncbi:MAG: malto-oligosyltrehalose trehalohydrolase [Propionivibrio sp.]